MKRKLEQALKSSSALSKPELIDELSLRLGITKKLSRDFLDTLKDLAHEETQTNGAFIFPGIGKLFLKKQKKRRSRNPAAGTSIQVPERILVKFSLFESCKKAILKTGKS